MSAHVQSVAPLRKALIRTDFAARDIVFLSWIPSIFVAGALGPYVGGSGLKTEHVLIYGIAVIYSIWFLPVHCLNPWRGLPISMPLWICLGLANAIGHVATANAVHDATATGRILAAVEHLIQPLAVVTVVWSLGRILPPESLSAAFAKALNVLVWGLCLNSLLVAWLMASGEMGPFAAWLPASGAERGAVWVAAMQGGRYSGIFYQPFESGLSYSLALLAWYRLQTQQKHTPFWEYARLLLLMFGGLVSVSKVFLLAAVPLLIGFVLIRKVNRGLIAVLLVFVSLGFVFYRMQESWSGSTLVTGYFSFEKHTDVLDLYTGNRFAHDPTQVQDQFAEVWERAPLFGFGFAPFEIIDSGFLWAFASGGAIGASIFVFILSKALIRTGNLVKKNREQVLPLLMLLLMVLASTGAPAFTINRGSTIFWTLYPLAILAGLRQGPLQGDKEHLALPHRVRVQTRSQKSGAAKPHSEPLMGGT